jgi:hypothetical protein
MKLGGTAAAGSDMQKTHVRDLEMVESWDDVPTFETEQEEAEFWDTHTLSDAMWDAEDCPALPPLDERYGVNVGFDADIAERARVVANRKGKSYVSLLKEFVAERLYEEERREGIIPADQS